MPLAEELVQIDVSPLAAITLCNGNVAAVTATASSTQATAVQLAAGINRVTGADGVRLPAVNPGSSCIVINDTGSTIKVWPPTGGAIQVVGTSFGAAVANANSNASTTFSTVEYYCVVGGASSLWAVKKSA